jgi:aminopeptidase N
MPEADLAKVMISWTKQKGHPVVTVHKINKTHISLSQNRFVLDSTFKLDALKE